MKSRTLIVGLASAGALAVLAASGAGIYRLGMDRGMQMSGDDVALSKKSESVVSPAAKKSGPGSDDGRPVLYWHDPMVPGPRFDKPGKSPFMDMDLVPVYADDEGEGAVRISPQVQQNLGIRTVKVTRAALRRSIRAVGSVAFNERDVAVVQARSSGYVERLHVRAPLDAVRKGQALAEVYMPDWVAAQEEYLTVRSWKGDPAAGLLDAARQRMRLAGMMEEHIRAVERAGQVVARQTIRAPVSGVVAELSAREGMTVTLGAPLFRIQGLDTVWIEAELAESELARMTPGMPVQAVSQAMPNVALKGTVSAILPQVDPTTRTVKARIELNNPERRLMPGMFVTVEFAPVGDEPVLAVPSEAVIRTGERNVVIARKGDGGFLPVEVKIGSEADGKTVIQGGLEEGQEVVASGQFLIDSEANLRGALRRMDDMPASGHAKESAAKGDPVLHRAQGRVEALDSKEITLSHGPVPSLKWGAMTMPFETPSGGMPAGISVGDAVAFEFLATDDGSYRITRISPRSPNGKGESK